MTFDDVYHYLVRVPYFIYECLCKLRRHYIARHIAFAAALIYLNGHQGTVSLCLLSKEGRDAA